MSASTFDTHLPTPNGDRNPPSGGFSTGRLDALVPHLIRGQLLRPGFVRMSLKLGAARQMPSWAKLQFMNAGVDRADLERVLGRIVSVETWADEWERLAREQEDAANGARARGDLVESRQRSLRASAAYNFSQYVIFMDVARKKALHEACVRAYAASAADFEPPSQPIEVMYRRRAMCGYLRVPPLRAVPAPVVVMFNGTNAVKEELHWWSNAFLERGIATLTFDGPGMGRTFHRLSMVAEPRPVGVAVLNFIETRPELDPGAVAFVGMSLGGYCTIRMAAHDKRIRAVAAVSPPFSADVYWQVTLAGMRRELAALYGIEEREMEASIDRITLKNDLPNLSCPLLVAGGGQDHITPATEARRIFEGAPCDRELVFYPRGAHDCFNVMSDLRPRIVSWVARKLAPFRVTAPPVRPGASDVDGAYPADAVDPEMADALCGEATPRVWHDPVAPGVPVRWEWPWYRPAPTPIEVVHRTASAGCTAAAP